jgi:uncharacterized membrane protein
VLASGPWYTSSFFWFGAGLAVSLVGLVATTLVTVYSRPRGRLVYGLLSAEPLLQASQISELQISYKGQILDDPQLLIVRLANEGGRDIPRSSFDDGKPLILDLNTNIVTVLRNASSRDPGSLKLEVEGSQLKVGPDLIRRGEGIDLVILANGRGAYLTVESPLIDVRVRALRRRANEPIPNTDYLRQYDELQPGAADRILRMVEEQRQFQERMTRARFTARLSLFLLLGLIFAASIAYAIYIGVRGQSSAAIAIAGIGVGVVAIGIVSLSTRRTEGFPDSRGDSQDE